MSIKEKLICLDEQQVASLTDEGRFKRGKSLFKQGTVTDVVMKKHRLTAVVHGGENYLVTLSFSRNRLQGECNCIDAQDFEFCKHCVAVALYVIDDLGKTEQVETMAKAGNEQAQLRLFLSKQSTDWLIDQFLELINDDKILT